MLGYLGLTEEQRNDVALYNQGVYHNQYHYFNQSNHYNQTAYSAQSARYAQDARYNQTAYSAQSGYYSQPISSNEEKRVNALIYLRERGKYLLASKFTPTPSTRTDVAKTIREYLEEVE